MSTPRARGFAELIEEASSVSVDGWDFSWLDGRATEERPPWGYARAMGRRLARATGGLDLQTGGGEVLDRAPVLPPLMAATEGWPPNVARAQRRLGPRGVVVVAHGDEPPLPFADGTFDLVTSRHPVRPWWEEITRVLRPGGTYFAQHVGPSSVFELVEYFLGPLDEEVRRARDPEREAAGAREAGLVVDELRTARTRIEFLDVGAVVYFLRKVIWMVPGFTVEKYRERLRELHELIAAEGPFVAHSTRHLVVAHRPNA
ncbi:methyltransferase type 11 [Mangrovactinospora gilvigrisea]|uniref:Methyltransferase type 11 n=1 Tax=Mangrovactinospora gilvigrisea TaxID=1428644 RepID=A0A1J7BEK7_9ACTN|nr:class I SAM-dependent methyltransferase [Mangrovactinospora gilvigrisea]OIV37127.1 methyltransferase type 11 [Mangrovactinospora gilvigrisea]